MKKNPKKYAEAGINENKLIKYTKKLIKEITVGKYLEAGDKYYNMIRTIEVD